PIAARFGVDHAVRFGQGGRRRPGRGLAELHVDDRLALRLHLMGDAADGDGAEGLDFYCHVKASANLRKPATSMVSARASGSIPAASHRAAPPSCFRLERSILRRWPKAAAVTRSSLFSRSGGGRSVRGITCTTAEATLGGGVKAAAGRCMTIRARATAWV